MGVTIPSILRSTERQRFLLHRTVALRRSLEIGDTSTGADIYIRNTSQFAKQDILYSSTLVPLSSRKHNRYKINEDRENFAHTPINH